MRRMIIAAATMLALGGCNWQTAATTGAAVVGLAGPLLTRAAPAQANGQSVATKESFEDSKNLYLSTVKRGAAAFRSGAIPLSTSPDVQRDNFCELVRADLHRVDDPGGELSALECKAEAELAKLGDALGRADEVSFTAAKRSLAGYLAAMDKIISASEADAALVALDATPSTRED